LPAPPASERTDAVPLTWDQPDDIAFALIDEHPDADPLDLNFVELHEWIVALPGFDDDPAESTEGKLEAIVLAWHDQL
jgi:FeS assembly protein IscX